MTYERHQEIVTKLKQDFSETALEAFVIIKDALEEMEQDATEIEQYMMVIDAIRTYRK